MQRTFIRRRRQAAYTIVEVFMAAVVLLMGIVGMIQVVVSGSEMLDVSRKQTIATQIIHSEIDKLHLSEWTAVNALPTSRTIQLDTLSSSSSFGYPELTSFQSITKGFSVTRTISTVKTDLKMITFTVTWTGNTGRSYSRSGSTYFGKNGLYVTYQRT